MLLQTIPDCEVRAVLAGGSLGSWALLTSLSIEHWRDATLWSK